MSAASGIVDAIEVVRPWISTGALVSLVAIGVKLFLDNRRLRLDATKRAQEYTLEVSADGRNNLQFIIGNLRNDITAQREQHAACQIDLVAARAENNETRDRLRMVEQNFDGLQRQFIAYHQVIARGIPLGDHGQHSPEIRSMIERLDEIAAEAPMSDAIAMTTDERRPRRRRFGRRVDGPDNQE